MPKRAAVLMAGGWGSRLRPLTSPERPKPLLTLGPGGEPLICGVLRSLSGIVGEDDILLAVSRETEKAFRAADLQCAVTVEPTHRGTLGCVLWTTALLLAKGSAGESVVAFSCADSVLPDPVAFGEALGRAYSEAFETDAMVCMGVNPTRPETGYGYIEPGSADDIAPVRRFLEKPDESTARKLIDDGCLWNSGVLVCSISTLMSELTLHQSAVNIVLEKMIDGHGAGNLSAVEKAFETLDSASLDRALLQVSRNVHVVRGDFPWDNINDLDGAARWRSHSDD